MRVVAMGFLLQVINVYHRRYDVAVQLLSTMCFFLKKNVQVICKKMRTRGDYGFYPGFKKVGQQYFIKLKMCVHPGRTVRRSRPGVGAEECLQLLRLGEEGHGGWKLQIVEHWNEKINFFLPL